MVRGMDEGPVYASRSLDIGARETAGQLHDRLAALGAALLIETLPGVLDGSRSATPQDHAAATYARKVSKAEAALDWHRSAEALARSVRAFNPWPVCEASTSDGRRLRIWEARALPEVTTQPPGSIIAASRDGIDVATGGGILRVLSVQPSSGKVMSAEAYLAAHPLEGGSFAA
jgi:methionyl-tRNA formyltransferase